MEIVEIVGLTVLIIALLALAGGFMARAQASTNLAWLQGVGTIVTRGRAVMPKWFESVVRGEQPRPPDEEDGGIAAPRIGAGPGKLE